MKIYGDILSGNCYKIKLAVALLDIDHQWIAIDILKGESKMPEFLQKNPNGQIPVLELDDGRCLSESNAILHYLAEGSELLPDDTFLRAKVLQWQFFEQYSHEPYIAVARFIAKYLGLPEDRRTEYESLQPGGHNALKVMQLQLQKSPYLVGDQLSIADISLYAYTHVADEGGFDIAAYPEINDWITRIKNHPRYIGIQ
jgi:glutathione S-transferase